MIFLYITVKIWKHSINPKSKEALTLKRTFPRLVPNVRRNPRSEEKKEKMDTV